MQFVDLVDHGWDILVSHLVCKKGRRGCVFAFDHYPTSSSPLRSVSFTLCFTPSHTRTHTFSLHLSLLLSLTLTQKQTHTHSQFFPSLSLCLSVNLQESREGIDILLDALPSMFSAAKVQGGTYVLHNIDVIDLFLYVICGVQIWFICNFIIEG